MDAAHHADNTFEWITKVFTQASTFWDEIDINFEFSKMNKEHVFEVHFKNLLNCYMNSFPKWALVKSEKHMCKFCVYF